MKLEEGMYVRTKYGIFKIRKITKDLAYWKREKRVIELDRNIPEYNYRFSFYKDESIFKGAKFKDNIIDLIGVGDILEINNEKYEVIYDESYEKLGILIPSKKELSIRHISLEYVFKKYKVSIVTKEQFESMVYEVKQ